jgi:hypothetical protein
MKATKELPLGYIPIGSIDIKKKRTLLLISILGLILMCFFSVIFIEILHRLRPVDFNTDPMRYPFGLKNVYLQSLFLVLFLVGMLILHEALHGVCFWVFSRSRPQFAFKGVYAYASLPGWYLPRSQYLVSALMPFFTITLLGIISMIFLPVTWFVPMLSFIIANAAGSVDDLVVVIWLLTKTKNVYALDVGDAVTLFAPGMK